MTYRIRPFEPAATDHEKMAKPFVIDRKGTYNIGCTWIIKNFSEWIKASPSGVRPYVAIRKSGEGVLETRKTASENGQTVFLSFSFTFLLQLEMSRLRQNLGSELLGLLNSPHRY